MQDTTQRGFSEGQLLAGKYRVERVIGEGGMGVVLAAHHEALGRSVAIKLLRNVALEHTDVLGRFQREARAAVSLRSEHVARVIDVGNLDDGRPFIVMERLEGQDLGDVIDRGPPLTVADAVDYVLQACEAIAEAHAAGIVHRDLKPKNLFLTTSVHGRPLVKVLDFGISKVETPSGLPDMQLTRTSEVIGSPSYMSPEQLRSSRNVDARTDIWALGVILYELMARRVPFLADTVTELVLVIATEPQAPLRSVRPDVPEGLEAVIARCLEKQPEHRFQSVVELVQALEPFAQGVQATATDRVRAVASGVPLPLAAASSNAVTAPATALPVAAPSSGALPAPAPSGGALPAPAPSGGALPGPAPIPSASSRVNIHGGTSVAWGETQSVVGPAPWMAPAPRGPGAMIAVVAASVLLVAGLVGAGLLFVKRAHTTPSPPAAVASEGVPLPPGRKDLPPLAPATAATAATPGSAAPLASAEPADDAPTPSALPSTRKAAPARAAKPPRRAPSKTDDLSNIGRR